MICGCCVSASVDFVVVEIVIVVVVAVVVAAKKPYTVEIDPY